MIVLESEEILAIANAAIYEMAERYLSDVETAIVTGASSDLTYEQIAEQSGYSVSYVKRDVGPKLWRLLSKALGEKTSKTNFRQALERYQTRKHSLLPIPNQTDWGEAPDVSFFLGRTAELQTLTQWIMGDDCRLVSLLGIGGIGKTALGVKLAQQIQAEFEFVIWRSLRNAPLLEELLTQIVPLISEQQEIRPELKYLLDYLRAAKCLLILDNLEAILQPQQPGQLRAGYDDYGQLLRLVGEMSHQSCLIVTSREKPGAIATREGIELPVRSLTLSGLQTEAMALLDAKGLSGSSQDRQTLIKNYSGNPLALKVVATSILDLFDGNIAHFLAQGPILFYGVRQLLEQQFSRLSPLEQTIMYWLAINREWTTIETLQEDIFPRVLKSKLLESLESLCWRNLIEKQGGKYTQQPVVMEYMTARFIEHIILELNNLTLDLFIHFPLLKTTVKDYVRESQTRLILEPIATEFYETFPSKIALEQKISCILSTLRQINSRLSNYGGGNLINLCCHLGMDLTGYDFSHLAIIHGYLQTVNLHHVDFTQCHLAKSLFTQTFGAIYALVFSPDSKLLVTGDANGKLYVWDIANNQPFLTFQGHSSWICSLDFSQDGHTFASGSADHTIKLWDLDHAQPLAIFQGHTDQVRAIAFSPDGKILASGSSDKTIELWDISNKKLLRTLWDHQGWVVSVSFSCDGKILASGSADNTIKLWDISTGKCLKTLLGHNDWIWVVIFSPNGKILASGSADHTIKLWDISTGRCLKTLLGHNDWVGHLAFSPDGKRLASSSSDETIKVWNISTGQCWQTYIEENNSSLNFSPDGKILAGANTDQIVKLWDGKTGQLLQTLQGHINWIWSVAFSPDGKTLATGNANQIIRLWNVEKGTIIRQFLGHTNWVRSIDFSPDGTILASGNDDYTIKLWDVKTGKLLRTLTEHNHWIGSVVFSPDGKTLATSSTDKTIKLWDVESGKLLQTLLGHSNWVWSVNFAPDGKKLVSGSADQTIKLWNISTGKLLQTLSGHSNWVWSVNFAPNGKTLVSGSSDQTIKLWDVESGKLLQTLSGHSNWVRSVIYCCDGEILASGSNDKTIKLWDMATGKLLCTLSGHNNWVLSVDCSPDGKTLASSSADETIKLWDISRQKCLKTFKSPGPYEGMKIIGVTGISKAHQEILKSLGAITHDKI